MTGELSIVAIFVNLLILIFVPLTMLFGFLAGVLGFIHEALAFPFVWISNLLLSYELGVVELFSNLPFASLSIQSFPLLLMLILYIGYGFAISRIIRGQKISAAEKK